MLKLLKRYEAALAAFEHALRLDGSLAFAWRNYAQTLRALGRNFDADEVERQAETIHRHADAV